MKMKMRRSRKPRPGTRRAGARFARSAHFHFHAAPSSGFVRLGLLSLSSFGGAWRLRFARVRVRAPRCPIQIFGELKFRSESSHEEDSLEWRTYAFLVEITATCSRGMGLLVVYVWRPQGPVKVTNSCWNFGSRLIGQFQPLSTLKS